MKALKTTSVVVALILIALGFAFFKPPVNYFAVTCLSTVVVWAAIFRWGRRIRWADTTAGALLQLAVQQFAYHAWLSNQVGIWWPLVQFIALQYVIVLRLSSTRVDTPAPPGNAPME